MDGKINVSQSVSWKTAFGAEYDVTRQSWIGRREEWMGRCTTL